ncbi:peptidylprolyl isomerase [Crocinitomix catalasitica]|nr:peptidylprolyl isomerase [Crocinitomix catalasitica]
MVSLDYTLKDQVGKVLDSSEGHAPLVYLHGVRSLIDGLEEELEGKAKGDRLSPVIPPEKAYGDRKDDLVRLVARDGFEGEEEMQIGMQVQLDTDHGPTIAIITKVEGNDVTLDLNHSFAGMTLYFDIEVVDIREATKEEIEHGHVHGQGGHHH